MTTLKDKVALVTGGSRGIGKAIVQMLVKQGCHVSFTYQKSSAQARELAESLNSKDVRCRGYGADVRDFQAVKNWVEQTRNDFGKIDILINNAGIIQDKALMLMTEDDWHQVIDTNLNGVFYATRACIVTFLKQKSGDIVNISSVSGLTGLPRQTNYSASKGGVNAFTKALAKEVAAYGIRVNAIAPGFIETEILSGFTDEQKEKILQQIPLGRLGTCREVAECVRFLLSDHARYITGQILQIDGGLAIKS